MKPRVIGGAFAFTERPARSTPDRPLAGTALFGGDAAWFGNGRGGFAVASESLSMNDADSTRRESPPSVPAEARPVVPLLPYQREDVESAARFRWNCWARQTGKSFTKSLRRILRGLARRRNQIFLSAGERQSRELMRKACQHCQALRVAFEHRAARGFEGLALGAMEIALPGGVRVIGLPANPRTARGFTGDVFLDEFAMHAEDRDIWAALFPTLLRGDGELDVASTPKGRGNLFHDLRDHPLFSASTITLPQAVAQGLKVDVEGTRRAMGDDELFRQEFLCEFLDETSAFLAYEQIATCVDADLATHATVEELLSDERDLFIGVDVGRRRDLTVAWVLAGRSGERGWTPSGRRVLETAAVFELSGRPFAEQFEFLRSVMGHRSARRCCVDAGGLGMQLGEQLVEALGAHRVEALTLTAALKSRLAVGLRIAVEAGRIRIPNDERIIADWHSIERTVSETGQFRLDAPRREGSHGDRFWAAALAWRAAEEAAEGKAECHVVAPIQFARRGTW